jgi:hypothetical protein
MWSAAVLRRLSVAAYFNLDVGQDTIAAARKKDESGFKSDTTAA